MTPDPGVIEVNVHPALDWEELVDITTSVYEDARLSRLGTEKFDLDGSHTGTGGGNHVVLGGRTPADSPFLRRPDLLREPRGLLAQPSVAVVFALGHVHRPDEPGTAGRRRPPRFDVRACTSRSSRFRRAATVRRGSWTGCSGICWSTARATRTARSSASTSCSRPTRLPAAWAWWSSGRFEMPPHARMSLAQQVLLRAWWRGSGNSRIARGWCIGTRRCTTASCCPTSCGSTSKTWSRRRRPAGFELDMSWFAPHFEFRFPVIGELTERSIRVELRKAIEPWYVLGEEPAGGFTARYVDSSRRAAASEGRGHDRPTAHRDLQRPEGAAPSDRHPRRICRRRPVSGLAAARVAFTRRFRSIRRWYSIWSTPGRAVRWAAAPITWATRAG